MNAKLLPTVGISCGDPNGIGIEVILKSLKDPTCLDLFLPVIYCNYKLIDYQNKFYGLDLKLQKLESDSEFIPNKINVVNVHDNNFTIDFGKLTSKGGQISFQSLELLTRAVKQKRVDFMVTAPINKKNIQNKEFHFPGHTDYLSKKFDGNTLMFMISEKLKLALLTDHIPINKVSAKINSVLIKKKVSILNNSLKKDFLISNPNIAVLSINPHVGDEGVIGNEDQKVLVPAVKDIANQGTYVSGPYSADSFFGSGLYKKFDAVIAAYHDQGLVPFKTLTFGQGVNFTAGLDVIRTSPDHGTAYEIAGMNIADPSSFKNAIYSGFKIFNNRKLN